MAEIKNNTSKTEMSTRRRLFIAIRNLFLVVAALYGIGFAIGFITSIGSEEKEAEREAHDIALIEKYEDENIEVVRWYRETVPVLEEKVQNYEDVAVGVQRYVEGSHPTITPTSTTLKVAAESALRNIDNFQKDNLKGTGSFRHELSAYEQALEPIREIARKDDYISRTDWENYMEPYRIAKDDLEDMITEVCTVIDCE